MARKKRIKKSCATCGVVFFTHREASDQCAAVDCANLGLAMVRAEAPHRSQTVHWNAYRAHFADVWNDLPPAQPRRKFLRLPQHGVIAYTWDDVQALVPDVQKIRDQIKSWELGNDLYDAMKVDSWLVSRGKAVPAAGRLTVVYGLPGAGVVEVARTLVLEQGGLLITTDLIRQRDELINDLPKKMNNWSPHQWRLFRHYLYTTIGSAIYGRAEDVVVATEDCTGHNLDDLARIVPTQTRRRFVPIEDGLAWQRNLAQTSEGLAYWQALVLKLLDRAPSEAWENYQQVMFELRS